MHVLWALEVCFINYGLWLSNSAKYLVDNSQVVISCEARKLFKLFLKLIFKDHADWCALAALNHHALELLTQDWIIKM